LSYSHRLLDYTTALRRCQKLASAPPLRNSKSGHTALVRYIPRPVQNFRFPCDG